LALVSGRHFELEKATSMTSISQDPETMNEAGGLETEEGAKPPLQLTVTVDTPSACQRHITVQVSRDDIERYFSDAVNDMVPKANVPGFRSGRAPRKLVESHFRRELRDQIKGALLLDAITQVSETQDFSAISEPDFDFEAVSLPDDGPLTFEFDLEVRPEFKLPNWKGLQLSRPVHKVTTEEIDEHIRSMVATSLAPESTNAPAVLGDILVADLEFSRDGQTVSEWKDQHLEIREKLSFQDAILDTFHQLVKGAKPGDSRKATLELSEEAHDESLRGETIEMTISVRDVQRAPLPQIDAQVLDGWGFESQEALRESVSAILERRVRYHQSRKIREQITSLLTESSTWELPPKLLERQWQRELDRAILELKSSGFTEAEIRSHSNLLRQNSQRSTATALKEHFILEKIAESEKIDADEMDFEDLYRLIAAQSNESIRSVRARIDKRGQMDAVRNQIIERKVIELIESQARFTEVPLRLSGNDTTGVEIAIAGPGSAEHIPVAKHGGEAQDLPHQAERS
jgi:trigger factor